MDSRNLDPAIFSHRFFTRAIPIAALLSALGWLVIAATSVAGLWAVGWILAGIRYP
jgi:hypothetical protein